MTRSLHVIGHEDRRCMDCGAANLRCPPDLQRCRWCGGRLETPLDIWR